jgi:hypothetical protein
MKPKNIFLYALAFIALIIIIKIIGVYTNREKIFAQYQSGAAILTVYQAGKDFSIEIKYKADGFIERFKTAAVKRESDRGMYINYISRGNRNTLVIPLTPDTIEPMVTVNDTLGIKLTTIQKPLLWHE